jgi:PPP family 3-phenylpropionic acid transporter
VRHGRISLIQATYGLVLGLLMPFTLPLLDERGLSAAQIGLIMGLTGVAVLVAYPVWGTIADGWLGRPRTAALASILAAVGGAWILLAGDDPVALTAAMSVAVVGSTAWGPLIDAITLEQLGEGSADYGRIRLWTSVGWAASTLAASLIWSVAGPVPVFAAFVAGSVVMALLVLAPLPEPTGHGADGPEPAGPPQASLRSWWPLLTTPVMLGFLAGLLVTAVGEHASARYVSLRILDQGGGIVLVGVAASLPALVEVPVFASSRRLATSVGLRGLFVGGALVAAVLMGLVAVAPEPWMAAGLRTLEGTSYAMRYMAMVLIIGVLMPRHLYALGQSVAWFVYAGIAPIVADVAGGVIYDRFGAEALFVLIMSAFLVGATVAWFALRGPRFRSARTAVPVVPPPPTPG